MKTMQVKPNNDAMVAEFLAKGGKITKGKTHKPKQKRNEAEADVVVIELEHLPKELHRLVGE